MARGARRRVPQASANVPDLLEQPLPRLSAARPRRDSQARPGRAGTVHGVVRPRRSPPQQGRRLAGGLGLEPVRPPAVRALLQVVHREGLGRPDDRDPRGVGGAAHQGPVVLLRGEGRVLRQQGQQGQEPDLGVQLPALRSRPDVGGDARRDRGAGRRGAPRRTRREHGARGQPDRRRGRRRRDLREPPRRSSPRCRCARWSR